MQADPQPPERPYQAILLDLDGTLVNARGEVHPRTLEALRQAHERGVVVMVATGRSMIATRPVLQVLGLPTPAVVFNGAGIYCPAQERMLEERLLSARILTQVHRYLERSQDLAVFMGAHEKFARAPRNDAEARALEGLHQIQTVPEAALAEVENVLRVTFLTDRHPDSHAYHAELEEHIVGPTYRTHFSLALLPRYVGSPFQVADVHAPCLGKAEALRYLEETLQIPPQRVVAVGDAYNDVPMVEAAGLGVCMGNGVPGLQRRAKRIIGDNEGPAIAELVEELFLSEVPT
ncbi:MAG: HAD family phosphatase, partial [Planctomycetes bacterium]|nr:HAD family phosphatase [Planctomycetota bacterium]